MKDNANSNVKIQTLPLKYRAALFLLLLLPFGCGRGASPEAAKPEGEKKDTAPVAVEMAAAQVHRMETMVSAQGTLAAGQGASARVAPVAAGRLVSVRVREGDRVRAGDLLALVDNRVGQAQTRSALAALTASEAQARQAEISSQATQTDQTNGVRLAQLTLQSAQLDRDNAIETAQSALEAAQTDFKRTRAGARPQEIAQSEQTVAQAQATRDRAATELQRVQFLNDKGVAPRRQLDDAQTALTVANAGLISAQQQSSLVRAGARAEDLRAADIRLQQAQQVLTQARTSGNARVAQARAGLRQAQQSALQVAAKQQEALAARDTAAQKRADLAAAQAASHVAELRAPISGIVTKRSLNPGDTADTTTPVVEITDSRALNLIASLPASDGTQVQEGMPARVSSPDAPDKNYAGRVLSVGQVDPQTNLLTVRIAVANSQGTLKAGTFANADIVVQSTPRAVVVPKQALLTKEGKTVVFVVDKNNVAHQTEVETGAEQNGLVEIRKGVASGAQVIRLGQYELADGAKVEEAKAEAKADDASKAEKP